MLHTFYATLHFSFRDQILIIRSELFLVNELDVERKFAQKDVAPEKAGAKCKSVSEFTHVFLTFGTLEQTFKWKSKQTGRNGAKFK